MLSIVEFVAIYCFFIRTRVNIFIGILAMQRHERCGGRKRRRTSRLRHRATTTRARARARPWSRGPAHLRLAAIASSSTTTVHNRTIVDPLQPLRTRRGARAWTSTCPSWRKSFTTTRRSRRAALASPMAWWRIPANALRRRRSKRSSTRPWADTPTRNP